MSFIWSPPSTVAASAPVNGVQYNLAGAFAAETAFSYDPTTDTLSYGDFTSSNLSCTFKAAAPVGAQNTLFSIVAPANSTAGVTGTISLKAGLNNVGVGGTLNLAGGDSTNVGGGVVITSGTGPSGTQGVIVLIDSSAASFNTNGFRVGLISGGTALLQAGALAFSNTPAFRAFGGGNMVAQPAVGGAQAIFVAGAGVAVQDVSTFDGYTIAGAIKALRNLGWLA